MDLKWTNETKWAIGRSSDDQELLWYHIYFYREQSKYGWKYKSALDVIIIFDNYAN